MRRSIVPPGFLAISHPIFSDFVPPLPLPQDLPKLDSENSTEVLARESKCDRQNEITLQHEDARSASDCSICLCKFTKPVTLINCRHSFCMECVIIWFRTKLQCPLCKSIGTHFVKEKDEYSDSPGIELWSVDGTTGLINIEPTQLYAAILTHRNLFRNSRENVNIHRYPQNHDIVSVENSPAPIQRVKRIEELECSLQSAMKELMEIDKIS